MDFLMISNAGEGAHLLKMIENEGNDVKLYIKEPSYRDLWDGLLPKVKKIAPSKNTVVIFDFSGMGKLADDLRRSGHLVVGGSSFADKLEEDRDFGFEIMEKAGIKLPLTVAFDDFGDIEEFLDKNSESEDGRVRRFVFKPSGKNLPCHLTYVSKDREDLLEYVNYAEKNYGKDIESFILQEFVEGVVVSTEAWSDGTKFIKPINHTVEVKALMNGCLGPATGCAGNLVWVEEENCRIATSGILKVEEAIIGSGYIGPVDLNAVVNDEGVWALEFTPRFGYDATPTQAFMFREEIGKFFSDLSRGQLDRHMPICDKFAAAVRFSIPPYPLDPEKLEDVQKVCPNIGIPVRGLTEKNAGHFYFYEVTEDDGRLHHSPGIGLLGISVGVEDKVWKAFDSAYEALSELKVPELQYRTDLGCVLENMYEKADCQDGVSATLGMMPEVELEDKVEENKGG